MYFAVCGKNKGLSKIELELIKPYNLNEYNNILLFDTSYYDLLSKLGGIVKYGKIIDKNEISSLLDSYNIVGVNSDNFGKYLKNKFGIKRYKVVNENHTDLKIKNKGIELLHYEFLGKDEFLLVDGYQNIGLFEEIDFSKPVNGMNIGMLPSKLGNIMLNIGLVNISQKNDITIYDPFVGFGTLGFISNYFGYDFIGSDINISSFKQNLKWWQSNDFLNEYGKINYFKNDIKSDFSKNILKNVNLILTEGYLGPIVKNKLTNEHKYYNLNYVFDLYRSFFVNCFNFFQNITYVVCIPVYDKNNNYLKKLLEDFFQQEGINKYNFISDIYKRDNQYLGRQILIINK